MNSLRNVTRLLVTARSRNPEFDSSLPQGVGVPALDTVPIAVWVRELAANLDEFVVSCAEVHEAIQVISEAPQPTPERRRQLHRARLAVQSEIWYHAAALQPLLCEVQQSLWEVVAHSGRESDYLEADRRDRKWLDGLLHRKLDRRPGSWSLADDELAALQLLLACVPEEVRGLRKARSRISLYRAASRLSLLLGKILLDAPSAHSSLWQMWKVASVTLEREARKG